MGCVARFARLSKKERKGLDVRPARIATLQATLHAVAADRAGLRRRQRALWKYRSMLDWTDIGKEGAFHTLLSEVAARRAL